LVISLKINKEFLLLTNYFEIFDITKFIDHQIKLEEFHVDTNIGM